MSTKIVDWELLQQSVVETALPAHMMYLAAQATVTEGFILREDVKKHLNTAAYAAFTALKDKPELVKAAALRTDQAARDALNKLNPDQTVHALYVSAMFVVKLVDENLYADIDNVAVSTGMVLLDDLKLEGSVDTYPFREAVLRIEAHNLISYLQKEHGLYTVQLTATVLG